VISVAIAAEDAGKRVGQEATYAGKRVGQEAT
jgi:hypothetical protein